MNLFSTCLVVFDDGRSSNVLVHDLSQGGMKLELLEDFSLEVSTEGEVQLNIHEGERLCLKLRAQFVWVKGRDIGVEFIFEGDQHLMIDRLNSYLDLFGLGKGLQPSSY